MVEWVAGLVVNLIDQRGERPRFCQRNAAEDIHRDESYMRGIVTGKVRVCILDKINWERGRSSSWETRGPRSTVDDNRAVADETGLKARGHLEG